MMQMLTSSVFLIGIRSFVGHALCPALISYSMYHAQIDNLHQFAQNMDATSISVAASMVSLGGTAGLYGTLMPQALLLTMGYLVITGLRILPRLFLFHFGKEGERENLS
jgi:hypothetical protein